MPKIVFTNAMLTTGEFSQKGSLAIEDGKIAGIWTNESIPHEILEGGNVIDLKGQVLMAGGIDAHVHFREPGMTHKADMASESMAAVLGGITSFVDMPNTQPPTTSIQAVKAKQEIAKNRCWGNYGFHLGATNDNIDAIKELISNGIGDCFGGVKVFMGSSTGNMLVDKENALKELFRLKGKAILIHSEDESIIKANTAAATKEYSGIIPFNRHPEIRNREACITSTAKALEWAVEYGTRLHILHVSTAEEVEMIRAAKKDSPHISAETSGNYLWFCNEDYARLGGLVKCNPAIKSADDREALRNGLVDGTIDTIGSDHAPHLLSEKDGDYLHCPSGMPSVQFSLPVVLTLSKKLGLSLCKVTQLFSENIADIIGIENRGRLKEGMAADLIVVDPEEEFVVTKDIIASKCKWSPYEGTTLKGKVKMVFVNGNLVSEKAEGQELVFSKRV